jgi:hypothetical protein
MLPRTLLEREKAQVRDGDFTDMWTIEIGGMGWPNYAETSIGFCVK